MLYNDESGDFYQKLSKCNSEIDIEDFKSSSKNIFRYVVRNKDPLLIKSHSDQAGSIIIVPLMIRGRVFGVLTLVKSSGNVEFSDSDLKFVMSLARRLSLNIENNILYESTYSNLMDTFRSLTASIQARDHYTESHSIRVTSLSAQIAEEMGCEMKDCESLRIAGMLHDIGKIAIPDNILLKPGRLNSEEYLVVKSHPVIGENIIKPIMLFDSERIIIRHHHEKWTVRDTPITCTAGKYPCRAGSFQLRILSMPW